MFNSYRRRLKVVRVAGGAFLTLGIVVLVIGLAVAAERVLRFDAPALRVAMIAIVATGLFALARWVAWPLFSRMTAHRAAARLGHACPKVEEDLVSAVELTDEEAMEGVSATLVESALQKIAVRSRDVDARHAVSLRPVFEAVAFFLIVGGLLLGAWTVNPRAISRTLERLFVDRQAEYWTDTRITNVEPADGTVLPTGSMAKFQATFDADRDNPTRCIVRTEDSKKGVGSQFDIPVDDKAYEAAGTGPSPFYTDVRWRIEADDGRSEWRTLHFIPVPSVASRSALVTPPDYIDEGTHAQVFDGTLDILDGSSVALVITPTHRGDDPKLAFVESKSFVREVLGYDAETNTPHYSERITLSYNDDGALQTARFTPLGGDGKTRTHEYIVTLEDKYELRTEIAATLAIRVMPDRLPTVEIVAPRFDVQMLPHESLPVGILARDDHRVSKLMLWYQILRKDQVDDMGRADYERTIRTELPDKRRDGSPTERYEHYTFSIPALDLHPGDRLRYGIRAFDNKDLEDETRFARSQTRILHVISNKEHIGLIDKGIGEVKGELHKVAKSEGDAGAHIDSMTSTAADADKNPNAQSKVARDALRAARAERRRAAEAQRLADKLQDLRAQAERNPTTPMETITRLKELEEALRETSEGAMKKAADALAQAAKPSDSKPSDSKPSDSKPSDSKPSDSKPSDSKPSDSKPSDSKPSDSKPSDSKPSDSKPSPKIEEPEQLKKLKEAGEKTTEAEEELRAIVDRLSKLRDENRLLRLADEALRLAARQNDVRSSMVPIARDALGLSLKQLAPGDRITVQLASRSQASIAADVAQLTQDIQDALGPLSFNSADDDLKKVEAAHKMLLDEDLPETTKQLAVDVKANKLLGCLPTQAHASEVLRNVAKILRDPEEDPFGTYAKKLQQFIKRQMAINTSIDLAIKSKNHDSSVDIGARQSALRRDVAETAGAIRWLARQYTNFEGRTADFMEAAANEMHSGALALYRTGKSGNHQQKALRHGKRALELLIQAAQKLEEETPPPPGEGDPPPTDNELIALLMRIIREQDKLNGSVQDADRARRTSQERFFNRTLSLAERQSGVGVMIDQLVRKLASNAQTKPAAELAMDAASYLDSVRLALDSADTTRPTRVTGQEAVALLELLLKGAGGGGGGGGGAGSGSGPGSGGGFDGGDDDPNLRPQPGDDAGRQDWLERRSRFEDRLAESKDVTAQSEYRALVDSYFRRLRSIRKEQ